MDKSKYTHIDYGIGFDVTEEMYDDNHSDRTMVKKTTFTLEEVKKAFWETFNESGELWFDYLDNAEENNKCTNEFWEDFLENLVEIHDKSPNGKLDIIHDPKINV